MKLCLQEIRKKCKSSATFAGAIDLKVKTNNLSFIAMAKCFTKPSPTELIHVSEELRKQDMVQVPDYLACQTRRQTCFLCSSKQ